MERQEKKLKLNKETIAKLNSESMAQVKGGVILNNNAFKQPFITSGCTDGCGTFHSAWNCTKNQCSADCNTNTVHYSLYGDCKNTQICSVNICK